MMVNVHCKIEKNKIMMNKIDFKLIEETNRLLKKIPEELRRTGTDYKLEKVCVNEQKNWINKTRF